MGISLGRPADTLNIKVKDDLLAGIAGGVNEQMLKVR
jgi:hypothetical protein